MEIYNYSLNNKEITYCPMHLNALVGAPDAIFELDMVGEVQINETIRELITSEAKCSILDFKNIRDVSSRVFKKLIDGLENINHEIIICNISSNDILDKQLIKECKGRLDFSRFEDLRITYTKNGWLYFSEFLNEYRASNINDAIKNYKESIITKYMQESMIEKNYYLESSNVYSNYYVNIKKFFNKPELFYLTIYDLCNLIIEYYFNGKKPKVDSLVCVSNNGAILAKIIGQALNLNVVYLMNLGPHYCIKHNDILSKIVPNKKYLFIGDFICLGTEYKIAKSLVNAMNSEIEGIVTVAKFIDIHRGKNLHNEKGSKVKCLVDLEKHKINYMISSSKFPEVEK